MFVLLPSFSWDHAVVNRRMRCLCKSLLSPFWEPPHTWRCWTMWLILCLTVWGTAIVLSRASAPSYPHQQNTSDHFSTSFPTLITLWLFGSIWGILMNSYHHGHQGHSPSGVSGRYLGTVPNRGQGSWHISLPNPVFWLRPTCHGPQVESCSFLQEKHKWCWEYERTQTDDVSCSLISGHPTSLDPATAAAKSLQSCPTLGNPIDGSPPGSPVPGILQARTLEWVAIAFSNAWKWKVKVKSLSRVRL